MSEDAVRLSMVGQLVRRRWPLLMLTAILGGFLGVGASALFSPGYESTSSVLLQGSLEPQQLQTEAQIATSSVVLERTAAALGGLSVTDLRDAVSAEVLDGNVIEISGSAETAPQAQRLADTVANIYIVFSEELATRAGSDLAQTLQRLPELLAATGEHIDSLRDGTAIGPSTDAELERLRAELAGIRSGLEQVRGEGGGSAGGGVNAVVLEPAQLPASRAAPTQAQLIACGAVLFFLVGVFAHLLAPRRDRRPRGASEIAAALGAPVVGSVDLPDDGRQLAATSQTSRRRWWRSVWRLLGGGRPWDAQRLADPANDLDRDVRYRRTMSRLRASPKSTLRLLVLVPDNDAAAHRAVTQLAVTAGTDGAPATIVTDDSHIVRLLRAAADRSTHDVHLLIVPSTDPAPPRQRTVLHIVPISAARPTIPDRGRIAGALLVLAAGTRDAWELVGIADACADAGYPMLGALVTHRARPAGPLPGDAPPAELEGTSPNGKATVQT